MKTQEETTAELLILMRESNEKVREICSCLYQAKPLQDLITEERIKELSELVSSWFTPEVDKGMIGPVQLIIGGLMFMNAADGGTKALEKIIAGFVNGKEKE